MLQTASLQAFEEGIVERQEFLIELCDLLTEYAMIADERPQLFRMLITFTSQFVDVATQNVIIARRLGHIVCTRLAECKRELDRKKGLVFLRIGFRLLSCDVYSGYTEPAEAFDELRACAHQRPTVLTMLGILHALVSHNCLLISKIE